jgi:hypothetical protein
VKVPYVIYRNQTEIKSLAFRLLTQSQSDTDKFINSPPRNPLSHLPYLPNVIFLYLIKITSHEKEFDLPWYPVNADICDHNDFLRKKQ